MYISRTCPEVYVIYESLVIDSDRIPGVFQRHRTASGFRKDSVVFRKGVLTNITLHRVGVGKGSYTHLRPREGVTRVTEVGG